MSHATTNAPASPRGDVCQFDPGQYHMKQGGLYVGHLVVVSADGTRWNTTEHWFLYAADHGTQNKKYVFPGATTSPRSTEWTYVGADPGSSFNGAAYKQSLVNAGLQIDYIKAVCTRQP